MAARLLPLDEVLPPMPLRQWVLTLPIPLRFLSAAETRGHCGRLHRFRITISSSRLSTETSLSRISNSAKD